jgi:hypothetical protein
MARPGGKAGADRSPHEAAIGAAVSRPPGSDQCRPGASARLLDTIGVPGRPLAGILLRRPALATCRATPIRGAHRH